MSIAEAARGRFKPRLSRLTRTTAFKLTLVYLAVFAALSLGLIGYISFTTSALLDDRTRNALDAELAELEQEFRRGGLFRLIRVAERRAMRPDSNIYLITDFSGNYIAGNVGELAYYDPAEARPGTTFPVRYRRLIDADQSTENRALAKLLVVGGGYRVLAGQDVEDRLAFGDIIRSSIRGAIVVVVALALMSWWFLSRSVLRKVDAVAASSRRIVAGDLSRRLPTDQSGDEFDRLSASVNTMLDEIERLQSGLQEVSQNIAHDLKTPLTRVRNRIDELQTWPDAPDLSQKLAAIGEECDGLIRTFEALLTIARAESHSTGLTMEPVDLSSLLTDLAEFYEPAAEDVGMQLELDVEPGLQVRGEPTLLRTMVANLLDNGMKYGASGEARLAIRAHADGDSIKVSVRDWGEGVGVGHHARLTDRFVRMDQARTKPGAGLGLSMVKAIASNHGGSLQLSSADPGFLATVTLPPA